MEADAVCTNWELFTGCREKPIYKEGTRRGRELPCYSTMEVGGGWGGGLPIGRGQERFSGTASTSGMGHRGEGRANLALKAKDSQDLHF